GSAPGSARDTRTVPRRSRRLIMMGPFGSRGRVGPPKWRVGGGTRGSRHEGHATTDRIVSPGAVSGLREELWPEWVVGHGPPAPEWIRLTVGLSWRMMRDPPTKVSGPPRGAILAKPVPHILATPRHELEARDSARLPRAVRHERYGRRAGTGA